MLSYTCRLHWSATQVSSQFQMKEMLVTLYVVYPLLFNVLLSDSLLLWVDDNETERSKLEEFTRVGDQKAGPCDSWISEFFMSLVNKSVERVPKWSLPLKFRKKPLKLPHKTLWFRFPSDLHYSISVISYSYLTGICECLKEQRKPYMLELMPSSYCYSVGSFTCAVG